MTRLASAVRAENIWVDSFQYDRRNASAGAPHDVTAGPVTLPSPQRLALRYPDLCHIQIRSPPDMLDSISRSWSFPVASLTSVHIKTDWPGRNDSGWRMHLRTLQRIINLLPQLWASSSSFKCCSIEYWLPPGWVGASGDKCVLDFYRERRDDCDPPGRGRFNPLLTYHLDTRIHDDFTSAARLLSFVARARPNVVELKLRDRETGTTHPDGITWTPANNLGPMANLLARWKCIDDALSSGAFANVTSVSVLEVSHYNLGDFRCVNPLVTQLLPRLAARNIFLPCDGKNCSYHRCDEWDDIENLQSVASTGSLDIEDLGVIGSADGRNIVEVREGRMEDGGHANDNTL